MTALHNSPSAEFDAKNWVPREYRKVYYPQFDIGAENRALIAQQVLMWRLIGAAMEMPKPELHVVGGGGVLWDLAAAAPYIAGIRYTDPFVSSLSLVHAFLEGERYWDAYVAATLAAEDPPSGVTRVAERTELIRQRIAAVERWDIRGAECTRARCEVVSAQFVADSITSRRAVWLALIRNLSAAVAPNGWLILSSLARARSWRGSASAPTPQPASYLTVEDIHDAFNETGLKVCHTATLSCEPKHRSEYGGLIAVLAHKR